MKTEKLVVAVAATAVAFGIGVAPPASAAGNVQTVGIEELLREPNGTEVAYTVTKIVPVALPSRTRSVADCYEATVMARALRGTVNPVVPFFNARAASGANYPALAQVSTLSAGHSSRATRPKARSTSTCVGDLPNSVVYDNGPEDLLTWVQAGEEMPGGASGGGSTGEGGGGSQGVNGSTGPNNVSPPTSGGESGNTGEGGTEGGGGNLDSGGGAGAPSGDTGD
jgi:hypothetical protein